MESLSYPRRGHVNVSTLNFGASVSGCNPIQLSNAMKHLQSISESLDSIEELIQEHKEELDYGVEKAPVQWQKQQPTDKYNFISEISRYCN